MEGFVKQLKKQCLDSNIIPVIISDDDKLRYCHALHKAQVNGDTDSLILFFEEEQSRYYEQIKRYVVLE